MEDNWNYGTDLILTGLISFPGLPRKASPPFSLFEYYHLNKWFSHSRKSFFISDTEKYGWGRQSVKVLAICIYR